MAKIFHTSSEFENSNPEWAARTANSLRGAWKRWQADAKETGDDFFIACTNKAYQTYVKFLAKYNTEVRQADKEATRLAAIFRAQLLAVAS